MTELEHIFRRENISSQLQSGIVWSNWELNQHGIIQKLGQCNITYPIQKAYKSIYLVKIKELNEEVSCNFVSESRFHRDSIHQYLGHHFLKFAAIEQIFVESGIWKHIIDFAMYVDKLEAGTIRKEVELEYNDTLPISFKMKDWKILSTFVGWLALLLGSTIALVIEIFISYRGELVSNFYTKGIRLVQRFQVFIKVLKCFKKPTNVPRREF